jgi:hypothetical protein
MTTCRSLLCAALLMVSMACSQLNGTTAPTFAPTGLLPGSHSFQAESSDADRVRVETTSNGTHSLMLWFDTDWERRGVEITCYQYLTYPSNIREVFSETVAADRTPDPHADFERSGWETGRYFCQMQAIDIPANQSGVVITFEFDEGGGEGGDDTCTKPGHPFPEHPPIDCPPGRTP